MAEWQMGDGSTLELVKNRLTIISESAEPGGISDISTVVLTPPEAVNLASALLQWATQVRVLPEWKLVE